MAALLARLGLGWSTAPVVYGAAALTGATTGLVGGTPVWAGAAKLEAVLKAAVGTFLAVTVTYGVRKWLPGVSVDLGPSLGSGPVGEVPAVLLPLVAFAIALLLEVDDAFGSRAGGEGPGKSGD